MKKVFLFIGALFFACSVQAQDIFKEHGFNKELLTLSKGKYDEVFTNKEIVQIGSVLLNTKTNKIVEFLDEETDDVSFVAEHSSRWLSPDPLAEKYYSISPYVFCLNNPIKYVDPDGKKVVFASGVSEQFKQHFANTVQFMNQKGTSGMLATLEKSETVYYINERTKIDSKTSPSSYNGETRTIEWNPIAGVLTNELIELSPATILNHEIDHALQHDQNPEQKVVDQNTEDPDYRNKEEKRVITGSEQVTAKKHGEIKEGEVTRRDHGGKVYETTGPTTTESVVTAPQKTEPSTPQKEKDLNK